MRGPCYRNNPAKLFAVGRCNSHGSETLATVAAAAEEQVSFSPPIPSSLFLSSLHWSLSSSVAARWNCKIAEHRAASPWPVILARWHREAVRGYKYSFTKEINIRTATRAFGHSTNKRRETAVAQSADTRPRGNIHARCCRQLSNTLIERRGDENERKKGGGKKGEKEGEKHHRTRKASATSRCWSCWSCFIVSWCALSFLFYHVFLHLGFLRRVK